MSIYIMLIFSMTPYSYGALTTIRYQMPCQWTNFAHFMMYQPTLNRLGDIELQQVPTAPLRLNLYHPRSNTFFRDTMLYNFATCDDIRGIDTVLTHVVDPQRRIEVRKKIETAYQCYLKANYTHPMNLGRYVTLANYLVNKNKKLIETFLRDMHTFYGVKETPWSEIVVYPCNVRVDKSSILHNRALLTVCAKYSFQGDLGTVVHETAHAVYGCQSPTMQRNIEAFFLKHLSPYARKTYEYFDEALATALGNGLFMERLTGRSNISYDNVYIKGLAEALYADVRRYIKQGKTMDEAFYNLAIKRFSKRFPLAKDRDNFIFNPNMQAIVLYQSHALNVPIDGFFAKIDDTTTLITHQQQQYNSPVVYILKPTEVAAALQGKTKNPYLKALSNMERKQVKTKKGLYYCPGEDHRIYLFFVIDTQTELNALIKRLQQYPYLTSSSMKYLSIRPIA